MSRGDVTATRGTCAALLQEESSSLKPRFHLQGFFVSAFAISWVIASLQQQSKETHCFSLIIPQVVFLPFREVS